jgi:DNA-binding CsgD family transcriptional regulator
MDDRYPLALIRKVHRLAARGYSVDSVASKFGLASLEVRAIVASRDKARADRIGRRQIKNYTGTRIRRLASLGHTSDQIAEQLAIHPDTVADFLARITSLTGAPLGKPRSRREQDQLEENRRLREQKARKKGERPARWRRTNSRLDSAGWTPPPVPPPPVQGEESGVGSWGVGNGKEYPTTHLPNPSSELPANPPPLDGPAWRDPRSLSGQSNGQAKLTPADVLLIRALHAGGRSIYSLAPEFGVSRSNIRAIVRGETWAELKGPLPSPADGNGP